MINRGPPTAFELGEHRYDLSHRALVVAILNRTVDSFYDGGAYVRRDAFLRQAERLVSDGADVVEVGARAAGVGTRDVTAAAETDLVAASVAALRDRFDVPIAVDTWRACVAEAAFAEGAVLGNDISGFADDGYLPAVAVAGASVVATHIRLQPQVPDPDPVYDDVVTDVAAALRRLAGEAAAAGIPACRVVVDPGLDLGKTWQQSVRLLANMEVFAALGHPLLLAASNKIFLGRLLGLDADERHDATVAACVAGLERGARLLRVHDARGGRHAADLVTALWADA
ncbi:MAG: dihydropteroate synthase [Actinomycetota bacterium]|nr:dihydropteroate synthase [Actinomycetota bacterium]